jgi:hypothetical protein
MPELNSDGSEEWQLGSLDRKISPIEVQEVVGVV